MASGRTFLIYNGAAREPSERTPRAVLCWLFPLIYIRGAHLLRESSIFLILPRTKRQWPGAHINLSLFDTQRQQQQQVKTFIIILHSRAHTHTQAGFSFFNT